MSRTHKLSRFAFPLLIALVSMSCGSENSTGPPMDESGDVVLEDDVVAVDGDQVQLLSTPDEIDAGVFRFNNGDALDVTPGSILIVGEGGGHLRKVTEVLESGETLEVMTEAATLGDVIHDGEFRISAEAVDEVSDSEPSYLMPGVKAIGTEYVFEEVDLLSSSSESFVLDGSLSFEMDPLLDFEFSDGELQYVNVVADVVVAADLEIRASSTVQYDSSAEATFIERSYPFTRVITVLPYVIYGEFIMGLRGAVSLDASAGVEAHAGLELSTDITCGGRYASGTWQPVWAQAWARDVTSPAFNSQATSMARLELIPFLEVRLYSVLGPVLEGSPHLAMGYAAANENWDANAIVGLDARVALDVQKIEESVSIWEHRFEGPEAELWHAPSALEPISSLVTSVFSGQAAADTVEVRVVDSLGFGVPDVAVRFAPEDGSVGQTVVSSDADGYAKAIWTLGEAWDEHDQQHLFVHVMDHEEQEIQQSPAHFIAEQASALAAVQGTLNASVGYGAGTWGSDTSTLSPEIDQAFVSIWEQRHRMYASASGNVNVNEFNIQLSSDYHGYRSEVASPDSLASLLNGRATIDLGFRVGAPLELTLSIGSTSTGTAASLTLGGDASVQLLVSGDSYREERITLAAGEYTLRLHHTDSGVGTKSVSAVCAVTGLPDGISSTHPSLGSVFLEQR